MSCAGEKKEEEEDEHTRLKRRCEEVAERILDCFSPHIRTNKEDVARAVYGTCVCIYLSLHC